MTLHLRALVALILVAGCTDPDLPTVPHLPAAETQPGPEPKPKDYGSPPPFAPLTRPGDIFRASDSLYASFVDLHESLLASRYVFYDSANFGLQFSSRRWGQFEYRGTYSRADSVLTLAFDSDTRWTATGIMRGDSLTVTYSVIASLSDFLDGVYVRSDED